MTDRTTRYLRWVRGLQNPSAVMRDFQRYLEWNACHDPNQARCVIPGTNHVRRMAPKPENHQL